MVRLGQGRGRLEQHQRWVGMERGLVAGKCRVLGKVLSKSKEADCAFKWFFWGGSVSDPGKAAATQKWAPSEWGSQRLNKRRRLKCCPKRDLLFSCDSLFSVQAQAKTWIVDGVQDCRVGLGSFPCTVPPVGSKQQREQTAGKRQKLRECKLKQKLQGTLHRAVPLQRFSSRVCGV